MGGISRGLGGGDLLARVMVAHRWLVICLLPGVRRKGGRGAGANVRAESLLNVLDY